MPRNSNKKKFVSKATKSKQRKRANSWGDHHEPEVEETPVKKNRPDSMYSQWKKQKTTLRQIKRKKNIALEKKYIKYAGLESDKAGKRHYGKEENEDLLLGKDPRGSNSESSDSEEEESKPCHSYSKLVAAFHSSPVVSVLEEEVEEEEVEEEEEEEEEATSSQDESDKGDDLEEKAEVYADLETEEENFQSIEIEEKEKEQMKTTTHKKKEEDVEPADPYRQRFQLNEVSIELKARFENPTKEKLRKYSHASVPEDLKISYTGSEPSEGSLTTTSHLKNIRSRLSETWQKNGIFDEWNAFQKLSLASFHQYKDTVLIHEGSERLREMRLSFCMHVLNHVVKSRDTITRNNERARKHQDDDSSHEYRDQGFVRPTVLILCPFRSSALAIVKQLIALLPKTVNQVHNRQRFMDEYQEQVDEDDESNDEGTSPRTFEHKPQDWQDLFAQKNNDDCFQIGLSLSRKAMRLYTEYYHSDIIIASPLGLRMKIGAEGETLREFDFLSSIEVTVLDQADVFLMQNWSHVVDIMKCVNQMPLKSHESTDFSRIREWNLEGHGRAFRQTIVLSQIKHPLLNSVVAKYCRNQDGQLRLCATTVSGTIVSVIPQVQQVFLRTPFHSMVDEPEARFQYFEHHIFKKLVEHQQSHTLLYIPSYFDYVRIRNFMNKSKSSGLSICSGCEYSSDAATSRARTQFFHGHRQIMLFTERFHFFKRYHIRGIRHIIFYGLPSYSQFYPELLNMLEEAEDQSEPISVISLFSKVDACQLEGVIGSKRAKHIQKTDKPTYLFC